MLLYAIAIAAGFGFPKPFGRLDSMLVVLINADCTTPKKDGVGIRLAIVL
jgi:hypothetical protein